MSNKNLISGPKVIHFRLDIECVMGNAFDVRHPARCLLRPLYLILGYKVVALHIFILKIN